MKHIHIAAGAMLLVGCAADQYRPIVDPVSIHDRSEYERDIRDCQAFARRVDPAASAAQNAVAGAILGALIGAAIGDRGSYARYGATVGAANGAAAGAAGAQVTQVRIIQNCMTGRGYVVLDGAGVPINVTNDMAREHDEQAAQSGSFSNVPCDAVKDEFKEQCAREHESQHP
jgi:uncharacterized protein YcfJ